MYNVDTIEWFRTSFKIDNSYFLNQIFWAKPFEFYKATFQK